MLLATVTGGDGAVIYLRTDSAFDSHSTGKGNTNLARLNGTLTVDLGGNTVTMGSAKAGVDSFLQCEPYGNGYVTNVSVINGTIEGGYDPLVRFCVASGRTPTSYLESDDTNPQTFNVTFNGITINVGSNAVSNFAIVYSYSNASGKANANVELLDCDINITNKNISVKLFQTANSSTCNIIAPQTVIRGGNISISDVSKVTWELYKHTIGDTATLKFGKNSEGNYPELILAAGDMPTSDKFAEADDASVTDLRFLKNSKTGASLYRVSELNLTTEYGTIPEDSGAMPWVVFDADKNFIKATYLFTTEAAKAAVSAGSGSVILLRHDYHLNDDLHGNKYLSNINGSITVDLGGNTLAVGDEPTNGRDAFIRCEVVASGYTTNINVKNGTVLAGDNPIVRFAAVSSRLPSGYADVAATNPHKFNVTLDGIKISYDPNASSYEYLILYTFSNIESTTEGSNNLIVKDCDIDFNGFNKTGAKLFASNVRIPADVVIKGGSISYDKNSSITWQALNTNNKSTLSMDKNDKGEYVELIIQKGKSAPTGAFDTPYGEYKFFKAYESSGNVIYRLMPVSVEINVKSSVVFYSDFIYRIYVEKSDNVKEITVGGAVYDLSGLPTEEIDGKIYYLVSCDVMAADAAEDITLAVKLLYADGNVYQRSWTLNIVSYASKVIAADYSEITDTLMLDMVNYIKSTYVYFASVGIVSGSELSNAEAKINTILIINNSLKKL